MTPPVTLDSIGVALEKVLAEQRETNRLLRGLEGRAAELARSNAEPLARLRDLVDEPAPMSVYGWAAWLEQARLILLGEEQT